MTTKEIGTMKRMWGMLLVMSVVFGMSGIALCGEEAEKTAEEKQEEARRLVEAIEKGGEPLSTDFSPRRYVVEGDEMVFYQGREPRRRRFVIGKIHEDGKTVIASKSKRPVGTVDDYLELNADELYELTGWERP